MSNGLSHVMLATETTDAINSFIIRKIPTIHGFESEMNQLLTIVLKFLNHCKFSIFESLRTIVIAQVGD